MNIHLKKLIFLFLFNIILFGCSMSTEELEQEISRSISEQIAENSSVNSVFDEFIGKIEFVDFQLIHKGGNEYIGILEVLEPNLLGNVFDVLTENDVFEDKIKNTYEVEVIYDGESFSWKIITE